jgi:hypothetical protein
MRSADDLVRQASVLAEKIRKRRASGPPTSGRETEDLSMMQSRLSELWTQIRLVRAGGPTAVPSTRPKWQ